METDQNLSALLEEQIAYYQARASEYDEWFLRQGRYDHGAEHTAQWFAQVGQIQQALAEFQPVGQVLEFACGTGWWTEQLSRYADQITAVDASSEVIALNQARLQSSGTVYHQSDIFAWQPNQAYDLVFFSFWLSHVPPEQFEPFWHLVARSLKPDGRVFFIDSQFEPSATAKDHHLRSAKDTTTKRKLNDGREFQIVKIFYEPSALTEKLSDLGWDIEIKETPEHFIYGMGQRFRS
ncbi:MAG: class I SAM-dependent methyltransferase [Chloroflexota bacterium]